MISVSNLHATWGRKQRRPEPYRVAFVDLVGTADVTTGIGLGLTPADYKNISVYVPIDQLSSLDG